MTNTNRKTAQATLFDIVEDIVVRDHKVLQKFTFSGRVPQSRSANTRESEQRDDRESSSRRARKRV